MARLRGRDSIRLGAQGSYSKKRGQGDNQWGQLWGQQVNSRSSNSVLSIGYGYNIVPPPPFDSRHFAARSWQANFLARRMVSRARLKGAVEGQVLKIERPSLRFRLALDPEHSQRVNVQLRARSWQATDVFRLACYASRMVPRASEQVSKSWGSMVLVISTG